MKQPTPIGPHLRNLRETQQLGIKSVGRELNISYSYLSKIENGHKVPSQDILMKLADLYRVDADDLLARIHQLPPDIQEILSQHGRDVFELIRKAYK